MNKIKREGLQPSSKPSPKPLSPLFQPNDFYYYKAQFHPGIKGLIENILGNTPYVGDQNLIDFDVNKEIDDIPSGYYSIPYEILEEKCNETNRKMYDDISKNLHSKLNNDTKKSGPGSGDIATKIDFIDPIITITDNSGITHKYEMDEILNTGEDIGDIILQQDPSNYNYKSNLTGNLNHFRTGKTIFFHKLIDISNSTDPNVTVPNGMPPIKLPGSQKASNTIYYQSIYRDKNGNKLQSDNEHAFIDSRDSKRINYNTSCIQYDENGSYFIKNIPSSENPSTCVLEKSDKIDTTPDLFIKDIGSMSFDTVPDYASINVYTDPSMPSPIPMNNPGPQIDTLIKKIIEYFKNLCDNKKKAEIYQNLVNNNQNNSSDELYEDTINKYYREYGRILNISIGIMAASGIIYNLSK